MVFGSPGDGNNPLIRFLEDSLKKSFAVYTQVLGHPKRGDRPDDRFSLNHWKITPAIRETLAFQT